MMGSWTLPLSRGGVALVTAALVAVGCSGDEEAEQAPPHVVVISLDTLRADRIGCYAGEGGTGALTPRIDALAAAADRYGSCTSSSSWTLPSHASMFTGLYPFEHGTHGFRVDGMVDNVHPLHPDHDTLAEEFQRAGYRTAGFVANTVYLAVRYGVAQGFDVYEVKRQPAAAVTTRVLEHLDSVKDAGPQLVFVNYMDMHRPYGGASTEELLRMPKGERPDEVLEALCLRVMNDGEPAGELGERVLALYDSALTGLDAEVGRLLDGLDERGMLENAVVVLTSDHGEAFGTHGIVEHAKDVYEPLVSVPLIVKRPGQVEGRLVEGRQGSSVDVAGLCAASVPGERGAALQEAFPRRPGSHPLITEIHFARPRDIVLYTERFQHERTAWRDGSFKFIAGGATPQLFNLAEDPEELNDLSSAEPQRLVTMQRALERFLAKNAYGGERLMPTSATTQQLKEAAELGYAANEDGDEEK